MSQEYQPPSMNENKCVIETQNVKSNHVNKQNADPSLNSSQTDIEVFIFFYFLAKIVSKKIKIKQAKIKKNKTKKQ